MKKGVLENFAKFTGKHLCSAKFSKNTFLREHLWTTASGFFGKQCLENLEAPFRYIQKQSSDSFKLTVD